jgi:hypothetical protein
MDDTSKDCEYIAICAICGYQWNETAPNVHDLRCEVCLHYLVFVYSESKQEVMGDDYDGLPWF